MYRRRYYPPKGTASPGGKTRPANRSTPAFQEAVEALDMVGARHQPASADGIAVGNRLPFLQGPQGPKVYTCLLCETFCALP